MKNTSHSKVHTCEDDWAMFFELDVMFAWVVLFQNQKSKRTQFAFLFVHDDGISYFRLIQFCTFALNSVTWRLTFAIEKFRHFLSIFRHFSQCFIVRIPWLYMILCYTLLFQFKWVYQPSILSCFLKIYWANYKYFK